MWERELETEQNCNILTPTLLAITAFLSCSPGLLNRRPGGPASLGAGFLYCILPPTLPDILSSLSYIIVPRPPSSCGRHNFALIQPVHGQGYNPDIPRPDAPVIYSVAFPILTARLGCRSIWNRTRWFQFRILGSSTSHKVTRRFLSSSTADHSSYF